MAHFNGLAPVFIWVPLKLSNSSSTCDTNVAVASILCSISLVIEIKKLPQSFLKIVTFWAAF
jgi:hypothetical protein